MRAVDAPDLLLFDQSEQFFVHHPKRTEREPFLKMLADCFAGGSPTKILIAIRGDLGDRIVEVQKELRVGMQLNSVQLTGRNASLVELGLAVATENSSRALSAIKALSDSNTGHFEYQAVLWLGVKTGSQASLEALRLILKSREKSINTLDADDLDAALDRWMKDEAAKIEMEHLLASLAEKPDDDLRHVIRSVIQAVAKSSSVPPRMVRAARDASLALDSREERANALARVAHARSVSEEFPLAGHDRKRGCPASSNGLVGDRAQDQWPAERELASSAWMHGEPGLELGDA